MTPSEVTFSMASAIRLPSTSSPAEIVDAGDIAEPLTFFEWLFAGLDSLVDCLLDALADDDGLAPAETFFMPSVMKA